MFIAAASEEVEGLKIDFRSFVNDQYEPKVFQPIWQQGGLSLFGIFVLGLTPT